MRILVTGGTGMLGSTFDNIKRTDHTFTLVGSGQYDLTDYHTTVEMLTCTRPDAVIHLAARVGGVKGNSDFVADFYSENIRMNTNVLDASRKCGVKKVLSLLSTCVYPDSATYPLTEDQMHLGPPHKSNFGYAYAKRMLDVQSRTLREQYGCNFICAIPNNLYGPKDNFSIETGHVIPAIIRKIWESKINNTVPSFWGTGAALREFTYSEDIAQILIFMLENYNEALPINIGLTNECSIKDVVQIVCDCLEYTGEVAWDVSKPTGQFRKPSSSERLFDIGWDDNSYTSLEEGIAKTCEWFKNEYPNVRGVN